MQVSISTDTSHVDMKRKHLNQEHEKIQMMA